MYDEERTITLSHHAKTRIHLVHLGLTILRMACDLAPHMHTFQYGFFQCQLPSKHTIDTGCRNYCENTERNSYIQKGPTAPRHHHAAHGVCTVHPFPSLVRKMVAYLEKRRNIADPFYLTQTYPDRPVISPFVRSHIPKRKKVKNPEK